MDLTTFVMMIPLGLGLLLFGAFIVYPRIKAEGGK